MMFGVRQVEDEHALCVRGDSALAAAGGELLQPGLPQPAGLPEPVRARRLLQRALPARLPERPQVHFP